jgi:transposase
MLVVETIAKIRRAYFSQGKAIKEICRDLHVSRKVVRKVIRSNATEFRYERSQQPLPRIGPWREQLEVLLDENDGRLARERLTLIRIFEDLRALGYGGSYAAVRRYAIAWREKRASTTADAYVPLSFAPGEADPFDWSHEIALIGGVTTTLKVAHVRLCHSRMMFVRAYPRESQEMVFDAHERAFAFFKGACARGIYDNMKTAVDAVFVGKDRQYNRRFLQMCSHHLVEPVACTPASGWEKGEAREPGRARPGAVLHAPCTVQKLRRAQRLAARPMPGLCEGPSPYRMARSDGLGGLRGRAAEANPLSRPVRRLPCHAGLGVEDLPRPFRQQQILGERRRGRTPSRDSRLRRPNRDPPGRPDCRRASALLRSRQGGL